MTRKIIHEYNIMNWTNLYLQTEFIKSFKNPSQCNVYTCTMWGEIPVCDVLCAVLMDGTTTRGESSRSEEASDAPCEIECTYLYLPK